MRPEAGSSSGSGAVTNNGSSAGWDVAGLLTAPTSAISNAPLAGIRAAIHNTQPDPQGNYGHTQIATVVVLGDSILRGTGPAEMASQPSLAAPQVPRRVFPSPAPGCFRSSPTPAPAP